MSTGPSHKLTIAIAGATGSLGSHITDAFIKLYHSTVGRILILTPNPSSEKVKALETLGVEVVAVQEAVNAQLLAGVDVLVNGWSRAVPMDTQDSLYKADAESGVKVYFLSEFGFDPRQLKVNHKSWNAKKQHQREARAASTHLKVIAVYTGGFLEDWVNPWSGMDTSSNKFTAIGSADGKVTLTSKADVGASVARLAVLAATDPSSVPDHINISGDVKSMRELAEIFGRESGEKIQVVEEPVGVVPNEEGQDFPAMVRLLRIGMSSGDIDFSNNNHNELVNPGESLWKWKTPESYAKAFKGKP